MALADVGLEQLGVGRLGSCPEEPGNHRGEPGAGRVGCCLEAPGNHLGGPGVGGAGSFPEESGNYLSGGLGADMAYNYLPEYHRIHCRCP